MLHLELQPETEARITTDAQRRGLSAAQLLEEWISLYVPQENFAENLTAGLDDIAAGRTRPAREIFSELHEQYAIRG